MFRKLTILTTVIALTLLAQVSSAQVSFSVATANDPIAIANSAFVQVAQYSIPFLVVLFIVGIVVALIKFFRRIPSSASRGRI